MSRLMLTMLGAVAEFERALISERTRLGMAKARADGKPIGRPRSPRPSAAQVRRLRKRGVSWRELAAELDCTVWVARQALAEKGAEKPPSKRPRKGGLRRV
jgi:DNA invertase Pin-like site-specific DNA recombinase